MMLKVIEKESSENGSCLGCIYYNHGDMSCASCNAPDFLYHKCSDKNIIYVYKAGQVGRLGITVSQ
jgi:hypothetical protein